MPYVHVDPAEVLDDLDIEDLIEELERRCRGAADLALRLLEECAVPKHLIREVKAALSEPVADAAALDRWVKAIEAAEAGH